MDPIRVPCSSCGGKLVIRSEKLLGQVVNCPRCKQFVQIPASASLQKSDQQALDSQALTSVDLVDAASFKSSEQTGEPLDLPAPSVTHDFESIDEFLGESGGFREAQLQDAANLENQVAVIPLESVSNVADPRHTRQSSSTKKRQFLLLSGLAVSVCLISVLLLVVFLKSIASNDSNKIAANPAKGDAAPAIAAPQVTVATNSDAQPAKADDNPIEPSQPDQIQNEINNSSAEDSTAANDANPVAPKQEPESAIDSLLQSAGVPDSSAMSAGDSSSPPAADQAKVNPLDLLLNQDRKEKPTLPSTTSTDSQPTEISPEIPDGFRDLAPVFDLGAGRMLPDARQISPDEVDGGNAGAFQVDVASLYHPDPSPMPVWDELKHTKVISLRIPNIPFMEALNTVESIYGIPCDWDLAALRLSQIDLNANVTLEFKDTTLEQVYFDLLASVGLKLNAQPNQLPQIIPAEKANQDLRTSVELKQLLASGVKAEEWLLFLNRLVPEADQKVKLEGESLVFTEDLPAVYRLEVAEIIEKVERAMETNLSQPTEASENAVLGGELQQWRLKLNKTGIENFARRRPVALMLSKLAREASFSLVVDWGECWKHGLVPTASMVALTKNRTLSQVSRFVLEEYALVLIVDKNQRLVLTTQEVQRSLRYFHIITIPEEVDIKTIQQSLAKLTPVDASGRSTLQVVQLPGDAATRRAVVRMCAPSVAQLADENLVTALGLEVTD